MGYDKELDKREKLFLCIEDYPEDKYGHSILIYGKTEKGRIIHVQCSVDPVWIITAYDPRLRPDEWESDFKRRILKK